MKFSQWLDTFLAEKQIDPEQVLTVPGKSGPNHIPVSALVEALKASPADHASVKSALVRLDFQNQPILPFLTHIAQAIAL